MAIPKNIRKRAKALVDAHERKKATNNILIRWDNEPLGDVPDKALVVTLQTYPDGTKTQSKKVS